MKKSFVVFPALVMGLAVLANAQATAAPTKVAVINIQQAIFATKDGQKASADLESRFGPKRSVLEKKNSEMQALQDQLKKGSATMSEDAKNKLARDIDTLNKDLTRGGEDYEAEVQQESGKVFNEIGGKMLEIIGKYAAQNGYAMVLDISNQQAVLWADPSAIINTEIVKLYDQAHPGTGAAPAGTAPAPAAAKPPAASAPKPTPPAAPAGKKQ